MGFVQVENEDFLDLHLMKIHSLHIFLNMVAWHRMVSAFNSELAALFVGVKVTLSRYFSVIFQCRNMFLRQWKTQKIMMQFCYLGLYHYTETIHCCLTLGLARMEMDCNLKKLASFSNYRAIPWKYRQKFVLVCSLCHHSFDVSLLVHLSILGTSKGTR